RKTIVVVAGVQMCGKLKLPEVVEARDGDGLRLGACERGQQQAGEDRDDGDDDEQLDERESEKRTRGFLKDTTPGLRWGGLHERILRVRKNRRQVNCGKIV